MKKFYCIDCGTEISKQKYKRCNKCSKIQFFKEHPGAHKGKNNSNYKDGRSLKKYYCKCGKEIYKHTYLYGGKQCKSCSRKGSQHYLYGKHMPRHVIKKSVEVRKKLWKDPKNHPRYIHGQGRIPYPIEFNETLKESIRKYDNHECRSCKIKQNKLNRKLDIHHIDYNKNNCKKDNLISLCFRCNIKVNANRDYWYAYFKYIKNIK
jgi:hypothetical protein